MKRFLALILSSAVFAVVHLVNLFMGAGLGATVLQIGYSFLIGGMCSVVLMKTGSIWHCVLLHAVYNFCGGVVPTLGGGDWWDTPTVILTVVLSVLVTAYVVVMLFRMDPRETDKLYLAARREESEEKTEV